MNPQPTALADFRLVPAPVDRFRRPPDQTQMRVPLRGCVSSTEERDPGPKGGAEIPVPFFWYDPPWHRASLERCRLVADCVGQCGVTIAALQSELCEDGGGLEDLAWPRLAPHRCDRAGWSLADAQGATVIELRMGMNRDGAGRYAYSAAQLARWQQRDGSPEAASGQPWVPLLFPPEWADLSQMGSKVAQLRALGEAAIYVSCDEAHLEEVLPMVCASGADGMILRCQDDPTFALQRSEAVLESSNEHVRPKLWLATGELNAQDAVKCLALGAAAVSIDWMCEPWLIGDDQEQWTSAQRAAINLGVHVGQSAEERLQTRISTALQAWNAQVAGIVQSLFVADITQLTPWHLRSLPR